MVKLAGLLDSTSEALGIAKPTVSVVFRALREAGLMTSGHRGRGAPDMTYLDQVRLLEAFLVTDSAAAAVQAVHDFGGMVCEEARPSREQHLLPFSFEARGLDDFHSFEEAVYEIVRMYSEDREEEYFISGSNFNPRLGVILPLCDISVNVTGFSATINLNGNEYHYIDRDLFASDRIMEEIENPSDFEEIDEAMLRGDGRREAALARSQRYRANIRVERSINAAVIAPLVSRFRTDR